MVPPPGLGRVDVARERSVAGEVRLRNGHMARDWLRSDSMAMRSLCVRYWQLDWDLGWEWQVEWLLFRAQRVSDKGELGREKPGGTHGSRTRDATRGTVRRSGLAWLQQGDFTTVRNASRQREGPAGCEDGKMEEDRDGDRS